jgi:hypothetical protein
MITTCGRCTVVVAVSVTSAAWLFAGSPSDQ